MTKYDIAIKLKDFKFFVNNITLITNKLPNTTYLSVIYNNVVYNYKFLINHVLKNDIIPKLSLTNNQKENLIQLFNTNPELFVELMNSYLKEEKNKLKLKEQNEKRTKSSISN